MTIVEMAKAFGGAVKKRGPEILTGLGITGWFTTTVWAVYATPKAVVLIEKRKKRDKVDKLTPAETFQTVWKCYIPPAITGTLSTACLIGASSLNGRRTAALAAAYSLSESTLRSFREKTIEAVGEKKEREIHDAVIRERVEKNPVSENSVVITDKGKVLCYDSAFGRYFESDMNALRKAENAVNRRLYDEMYISLNEFYDELGLPPITIGYDLGWRVDKGNLELFISAQVADDGKTPCLAFEYNIVPEYGFNRTY